MGELSRKASSRVLVVEDAASFTSFPDLSTSAPPRTESESSSNEGLLGLLDRNGPSMFDDTTAIDPGDPQTLSAAPRAVLKDLVDYHGAVDLVQRLSLMLAQRDAHITALTRLAEDYKVPRQRISDAASRAKQAERRRLSLATASEDLDPPSAVGSVGSTSQESGTSKSTREIMPPPPKGITKLFAGGARKAKPGPIKPAVPLVIPKPRRRSDRPQSVDAQSIRSVESVGWAASINNMLGSNKQSGSGTPKLPVEMVTRVDKDQLPPTLSQQTEDPQEAEWNKFILKLVELRQQNGEDLNGGELIGASRFGQEGSSGQKKLETLTRLVVGGIPMKLRHPLWMELSNTQAMMQPDTYEHFLNSGIEDDPTEIEAILKDVPRTLTSKYDFYSDKGFQRLRDLLVAFVAKYPSLGYTQGLNTIAGYLLLAIPSEEDAFWVLCNIVENFFPADYFARSDAMTSPLADSTLLRQYLKELIPQLHQHLEKLGIQPDSTVPMKWFFTAFSSTLPETALMRLWDIWLCLPNQKQFPFAFALTLLVQNTEDLLKCEDGSSFFAYMDSKLKLPEDPTQLTELMKQAFKIGKKLGDNLGQRRIEEAEKAKSSLQLDNRLRRRRTQSLEMLVDRDDEVADEVVV